MKKLFITTIALAAILSLGACGDKSEHKHKSRNRDNKESILFSSKANKEEKEESESDEKESHKSKISDIGKYTMLDAFDKTNVHIYYKYPQEALISYKDSESDYHNKISYSCTIKRADTEKIIVEAKADYSKCEEEFKKKGYKFESDIKTYEISTDDLEQSALLREDQLAENQETIIEFCQNYASTENLKKIYVLLPPKNTVFTENLKCRADDSTGFCEDSEEKMLQKQVFFVNYASSILNGNSGYQINSCKIELQNFEDITKYTNLSTPEQEGLVNENGEMMLDENGKPIYALVEEDSIQEYFDGLMKYYRNQGYSFEIKEIPIE